MRHKLDMKIEEKILDDKTRENERVRNRDRRKEKERKYRKRGMF